MRIQFIVLGVVIALAAGIGLASPNEVSIFWSIT